MLAALTRAKPKIANYPFTTINPNLGVSYYGGKEITLADIPGLIEGAAEGKGLGTQFLRHIERTRVLVFLIDGTMENINEQYQVLRKELDKYCKNEQILHQGYVAEIEPLNNNSLKEFIKLKENITLACLQDVTDPRNIGSVIRSAASFNIDGIIVKERLFPENSKSMYKASSGSIEYTNIFKVANINSTLKFLREKNFWVYGFSSDGNEDFTNYDWKGNNILLFGSEGFGMHQHTSKYADFLVKIDINSRIESLNISNSAAIVFHHLSYLKKKS